MPTDEHEYIMPLLAYFIVGWGRQHQATIFGSGYKVKIAENRGVMPDLHVYLPTNRADRRTHGVFSGHPDLAVEIISTSSRRYDRVTKLQWYASIGVPEYWLVDPADRTLERFVLGTDGFYGVRESLTDDAIFRPESFPGLEIPLAELWSVTPPSEG